MSKREQFMMWCDLIADTLEPFGRVVQVVGVIVGGAAAILVNAATIYDTVHTHDHDPSSR
jgi:hypothetical protein